MDYLAAVRAETAALADAAERGTDAPVPPCPGWTVGDVAVHVGQVHRRFEFAVRTAATERPTQRFEPPGGAALGAWVRQGAEALVATLAAAPDDRLVWSWRGTSPVPWVRRRMAHETAVHRWDADAAHGDPAPVPADLAADGIDEFLDECLGYRCPAWTGEAVSVHLHRTDGPGEWLVEVDREGLRVRRAHGRGDAAVRGRASDLLLLLWRRRAPRDVEVHGDAAALEALLDWPEL